MNAAEIAKYLRLHKGTVLRLVRQHVIPGFRIGTDWRFNREQIDAWRLKLSAPSMSSTAKE